jgi:hypothetical protein
MISLFIFEWFQRSCAYPQITVNAGDFKNRVIIPLLKILISGNNRFKKRDWIIKMCDTFFQAFFNFSNTY